MQSLCGDSMRCHRLLAFLCLPGLLPLAPACGDSEPPPPVEHALLPSGPPDLDVLFLIDNSAATAEKQTSIAVSFPAFVSAIRSDDGTLPNLHIGVISSDVGIAPYGTTGCEG